MFSATRGLLDYQPDPSRRPHMLQVRPEDLNCEHMSLDSGVQSQETFGCEFEAGQEALEVGPGGYCPPRHPTHYEPLFFVFNGILWSNIYPSNICKALGGDVRADAGSEQGDACARQSIMCPNSCLLISKQHICASS